MKRALVMLLAMGSVAHAEGEITSCQDLIDKDSAIVFDHAERIEGGQKCYVRPKDGGDPSVKGIVWDTQTIKEDAPQRGRCKKWAKHFTCKIKDAVPPGEETSARCRQQQPHAVTPAEAKQLSDANVAAVKSEPRFAKVLKLYERTKKEVTKELKDKKAWKTGEYAFDQDMFPKFSGDKMCPKQPITEVNIGMPCGTYEGDFAAANSIAGLGKTPKDCTWHHHEDLGVMQLVSTKAHNAERHTGGLAIWRRVIGYQEIAKDKKLAEKWKYDRFADYPLCCPAEEE